MLIICIVLHLVSGQLPASLVDPADRVLDVGMPGHVTRHHQPHQLELPDHLQAVVFLPDLEVRHKVLCSGANEGHAFGLLLVEDHVEVVSVLEQVLKLVIKNTFVWWRGQVESVMKI